MSVGDRFADMWGWDPESWEEKQLKGYVSDMQSLGIRPNPQTMAWIRRLHNGG